MTLRSKYILFIVSIHLVTLLLTFYVLNDNMPLFILSEFLLLCSVYYALHLYRSLVEPIYMIARGADAIADEDFNVKLKKVGQKELDKLITVYNQMIDKLRQERATTTQKNYFLDKLIATSPSGIILLDLNQKLLSCNPQAVSLLNYPEALLIGKALHEVPVPLLQKLARFPDDYTRTIQLNGMEIFKCHKAHFMDKGYRNYFLVIEELTDERIQIEKEAYEKVIRMMAHEVNNSIGPINSILESLNFYIEYIPEAYQSEYANVLRVAIERNQKLNVFMKNFSEVVKLPAPILERIDIKGLIADVLGLMKYQVGEKRISFTCDLPAYPVLLEIDPRQMEQVLINIIKNAIEAIPEEGNIKILLKENPIQLLVVDSGTGIPEQIAPYLFTSFFSTKPYSQGIGLTLSREILLNHGFHFSLKPKAEAETVFEIQFTGN